MIDVTKVKPAEVKKTLESAYLDALKRHKKYGRKGFWDIKSKVKLEEDYYETDQV
jgi:hypothetical protein